MKNLVLLLLVLAIFSCKKEKNFPDTYEELKAAERKLKLKQVENCSSEYAKLLCSGKWKVEFHDDYLRFIKPVFDCSGSYSESSERPLILHKWKLEGNKLQMGCFYGKSYSENNASCLVSHDYLLSISKDSLLISLIDENSHELLRNACTGQGISFKNNPLPLPTLHWLVDSLNSKK